MYHFNDEYLLNLEKKYVCNPLCTHDLSRQFNTPPFHDFFRKKIQILKFVQFKSAGNKNAGKLNRRNSVQILFLTLTHRAFSRKICAPNH